MVIAPSFGKHCRLLAGRLVNRLGKITLRTPTGRLFATASIQALEALRAIKLVLI
jgi:hypothetical protein